jgi:DNA-binding NarL/FixJ family response regulator
VSTNTERENYVVITDALPSPFDLRFANVRGKTPVFVYAVDPVSAAGAKSQLMNEPTIQLVGPMDIDMARVAVLVADCADTSVVRIVKAIQRDGIPHVLLVAGHFEETGVVAATAAGVTAFLRKSEATSARLTAAIHDVEDSGCHLPDGLMRKAAAVRLRSAEEVTVVNVTESALGASPGISALSTMTGNLTVREAEVLRLVADGHDTADVAEKLGFSESTVKGIMAKIMTRIDARNRCHAVAIAVRNGLI